MLTTKNTADKNNLRRWHQPRTWLGKFAASTSANRKQRILSRAAEAAAAAATWPVIGQR